MTGRADIFADDDDADVPPKNDDLDLSVFKAAKRVGPPADAVRKVAEGSAFKSREVAKPEPVKQEEPPKRRERRIYRTGRDAHFSCKAKPETVDEFYGICNEQGWVMGETLERAVAALKRELGQGPSKPS